MHSNILWLSFTMNGVTSNWRLCLHHLEQFSKENINSKLFEVSLRRNSLAHRSSASLKAGCQLISGVLCGYRPLPCFLFSGFFVEEVIDIFLTVWGCDPAEGRHKRMNQAGRQDCTLLRNQRSDDSSSQIYFLDLRQTVESQFNTASSN
jgi:hypothetical protein